MKNSQKRFVMPAILTIVALLLIAGGVYIYGAVSAVNDHYRPYAGVITKNGDNTSTYSNSEYKFKLSYPSTWQVGNNYRLGQGTFQLYNFEASDGGYYGKGMNKIEMSVITDRSPSLYFEDYDHTADIIKTEVAGQEAYKLQRDNMLSYVIKLPVNLEASLAITIYGDPANYADLEDILKSLTVDVP